jgi:hypothetical protein
MRASTEGLTVRRAAPACRSNSSARCSAHGRVAEAVRWAGRSYEKGRCRPFSYADADAEQAGISERQVKTAVRVANVLTEKFEAAVEQQKPATVTQLAEMGQAGSAVSIAAKAATGRRFVRGIHSKVTEWSESFLVRFIEKAEAGYLSDQSVSAEYGHLFAYGKPARLLVCQLDYRPLGRPSPGRTRDLPP